MLIRSKEEGPAFAGPGIVSTLLLSREIEADTDLTLTWVVLDPGARQPLHSHPQEQAYVILEGHGRVRVDEEESNVGPGDLIYLPRGCNHELVNIGQARLTYLSAATPPVAVARFYRR